MRFRWNGRSRVALATWAASACVLAGMGPVQADDPSVAQIEAKLARSRAHLHDLYASSASAASRFDSATQQLAEANRNVERERSLVRATNAQLSDQSDAIAELTVQQLQGQTDIQRLSTMLRSGDPQDLLEQAAAYDSAAEAMTAQIDELTARTAVHEAAQHRFERARTSRQQAVDQLSDNRAAINAAIATSQAETKAASAERTKLLKQLAAKTNRPVEVVAAQQSAAEDKASGPAKSENPPKPADEPQDSNEPDGNGESESPPADEPASSEPDGVWDKIAKCESGGNWHINTGNGYYGGLQFSAATWKSVGGPGLPHQYSREVQIKYAKILQARSGWGQWSCAGARFD